MVWNPYTGEKIAIIEDADANGGVTCLRWLGGAYLASGGLDKTIKIWELSTWTMVRRLTGHTGAVNVLEVLTNGYLASGSSDKTIKLWNVNTALMISNILAPFEAQVYGLKQTGDELLAITGASQFMYFYNLSSLQVEANVELTPNMTSTSRQIIVVNNSSNQLVATANSLGYVVLVDSSAYEISSVLSKASGLNEVLGIDQVNRTYFFLIEYLIKKCSDSNTKISIDLIY